MADFKVIRCSSAIYSILTHCIKGLLVNSGLCLDLWPFQWRGGFQVFFQFPTSSDLPPAFQDALQSPPLRESHLGILLHSASASDRGSAWGWCREVWGQQSSQPECHAPTAPSVFRRQCFYTCGWSWSKLIGPQWKLPIWKACLWSFFWGTSNILFSLSRLCSSIAQPTAGFVAVSIFPM